MRKEEEGGRKGGWGIRKGGDRGEKKYPSGIRTHNLLHGRSLLLPPRKASGHT